MQNVKVRRTGISADDAAQVLRDGLGDGYEIQADGEGLLVHKGLTRAKVNLRAEEGGTVFDVNGAGASVLPLFSIVTKMLNDRGIAKRTAAVIGEAAAFRDDD
ncbi:MAG TPA: hypothetical protein VF060_33555 [Trebonia sp.]